LLAAAATENVKIVGLGLLYDDDPIKAGNLGDLSWKSLMRVTARDILASQRKTEKQRNI
jgi:hypothetical protein